MADFKPGDLVKIHRPNKKGHGQAGRYAELGQDPRFAWVAFHADKRKVPDANDYITRPRKLFPLSQIQRYEPQ